VVTANVDRVVGSGGVAGAVACQENHEVGDVLWGDEPARECAALDHGPDLVSRLSGRGTEGVRDTTLIHLQPGRHGPGVTELTRIFLVASSFDGAFAKFVTAALVAQWCARTASTSASVTASPMPVLAPVTTVVLPTRCRSISLLPLLRSCRRHAGLPRRSPQPPTIIVSDDKAAQLQ